MCESAGRGRKGCSLRAGGRDESKKKGKTRESREEEAYVSVTSLGDRSTRFSMVLPDGFNRYSRRLAVTEHDRRTGGTSSLSFRAINHGASSSSSSSPRAQTESSTHAHTALPRRRDIGRNHSRANQSTNVMSLELRESVARAARYNRQDRNVRRKTCQKSERLPAMILVIGDLCDARDETRINASRVNQGCRGTPDVIDNCAQDDDVDAR